MRSLLCFARADGKQLWQKDVAYDTRRSGTGTRPGTPTPRPATDGERVVVSFGSAGLYCYDLDGKELWKRTDLGKWEHHVRQRGRRRCCYGDLVIQWCGPNERKGRNFLLAVNKKTGKTVWEHDETYGSWSTPLIVKVNGKDQLLLGQSRDVKGAPESKTGYLKGFDPKTGKELWKCQGLNSYVYTSPLVRRRRGGGHVRLRRLGPGGQARRHGRHHQGPALAAPQARDQRVGSGVIVGEHVYMVDENGAPHCYELKTGKDLWKDERKLQGGTTWGSMVHADGRLYLLMRNGETVVFAANPKYEVLAINSLGRASRPTRRWRSPTARSSSARSSTCGASARRSDSGQSSRRDIFSDPQNACQMGGPNGGRSDAGGRE